jgi:hypothetical protein
MSQLQNRFPPEIEQFWTGWYECLKPDIKHSGSEEDDRIEYCEQNHADCLHHVISPTAYCYVKGKHNESVFNSSPVNNENCHLGKPMQNEKLQKALLNRVYEIVMNKVDHKEYYLTDKDYKFLKIYKKFYDFLN